MTLVLQEDDVIIFIRNPKGEVLPLPDDIKELETNGCLGIVTKVGEGFAEIRDLDDGHCNHPRRFRIRSADFSKLGVLH